MKEGVEAEGGDTNFNWTKSFQPSSLSHIFPLNKFDVEKCITRHFDKSTREALKSIASSTKPRIIRAPAKAVVYCKDKADEGDDDDDSEEEGKEDEEGEGQEGMMSMVKDLS
ncbi:hypothetical protein G6F42_020313 [Rhizopus arrhizus]|nr:hypothetical protein G6F42_020313 [Rhizopus arrhizus]